MLEPFIIAEIGCNHKGDINIAKNMIEQISIMKNINSFSAINCVKFQKRTNKLLLSEKEYNAPHPIPENSYAAKISFLLMQEHIFKSIKPVSLHKSHSYLTSV